MNEIGDIFTDKRNVLRDVSMIISFDTYSDHRLNWCILDIYLSINAERVQLKVDS